MLEMLNKRKLNRKNANFENNVIIILRRNSLIRNKTQYKAFKVNLKIISQRNTILFSQNGGIQIIYTI